MTCNDTNRSRLPIHPLWNALISAQWQLSEEIDRTKLQRVTKQCLPQTSKLIAGLGYIVSFMAKDGCTDVREGFQRYEQFVRHAYTHKLRGQNKTFEEHVRECVREKSTLYATMDNREYEPRRRRFQERYTKGNDGK